MGYATTRTLERVAAAIGLLESAPVQFQPTCDVTGGGVLMAVPALLAQGLLRHRPSNYQLPKGFYGIDSIFLVLALMALARIRSVEQLRYQAPGEWGKVLGLDRIPEVRTLREKIERLCQDPGRRRFCNCSRDRGRDQRQVPASDVGPAGSVRQAQGQDPGTLAVPHRFLGRIQAPVQAGRLWMG